LPVPELTARSSDAGDGVEISMPRTVHAVALAAFALVSGDVLAADVPPFAAAGGPS